MPAISIGLFLKNRSANNQNMRNTIIHLLGLCIPMLSLAQTPHPWEIGGGVGLGAYEGDLQIIRENLNKLELSPSFSAHLRHNLSNNFAGSLGLVYTGLAGNDLNFKNTDYRHSRGFSFNGTALELSIRGEIYPFGIYKFKKRRESGLSETRKMIVPYAAIGVGGAFFRPKTSWNDGNGSVLPALIQEDKAEAKAAALSIPMELGLQFRIKNRFTIGLAGVLRYTPSDYLDGVSAAAIPGNTDWFYTLQTVASYAFGKTQKQATRKSPPDSEDLSQTTDTDQDGVVDARDECPDIPGTRSTKGCPDADRDGISDAEDHCPELIGLPTLNGCPDRDEDGIIDPEDACPDLKGVQSYRGCPAVDRDKDGISDVIDLCPDMSGQVQWKGCPDSDSDGIPDNKDGCPGIAGPEKLRGCPDTDGDGISDKEDECPTISGLLIKKGCPEALPAAAGVPYKALYFNSRLDDWQVTSLITMEEVVAILQADSNLFARIEGHTDNTGKEPANDLLAEKRAQKCRDNLVAKGISIDRLNYIGLGSKKPAVPNDTREHRQLNRRVEIHFYKK